ncbi:MAG TPA: winged helix-turn-helix domain-containing protein [Nitrososphaerales archaeon]|nr:winged helix-turn-helix domain-containing protein [Nitrososphaerales archaeon]
MSKDKALMRITEVKSRMGAFCVIEMCGYKLVTPCDTRVKILQSLVESDKTADDLSKEVGASYSTVMDHMDLLERIGIVQAYLRKTESENGRRRICFKIATET